MNKILTLSFVAAVFAGCSGSNGSDVASQEELQKDLTTIMEPKVPMNVVVKPDTVMQDSNARDTNSLEK